MVNDANKATARLMLGSWFVGGLMTMGFIIGNLLLNGVTENLLAGAITVAIVGLALPVVWVINV